MELLVAGIAKNYEPSEAQLVMFQWGLLDLQSIRRLKAIHRCKTIYFQELISLCIKFGISWHDVAIFDMLLVKNFPERYKWRHLDIEFKDSQMRLLRSQTAEFWSVKLQQILLDYNVYNAVVSRIDKNMFWIRLSEPETLKASYVVGLLKSNHFFISNSIEQMGPVVESIKSLLEDSTLQERIIHHVNDDASQCLGVDDTEGSCLFNTGGGHQFQERCNFALDTGFELEDHDVALNGMLMLLGSDVKSGLENLQEYGFFTSAASL